MQIRKRMAALLALLLLMPLSGVSEEMAPAIPQNHLINIRINEFMASNGESLYAENGSTPDWIELYNAGEEEVNLKGLCLSDGKKTLDKFVFPDYILPPHGFLVIFASGKDRITETEIHLPFKLSADGERVVLSFGGAILDIISFDQQERDIAMARLDEKTWKATSLPTPGKANEWPEEEK